MKNQNMPTDQIEEKYRAVYENGPEKGNLGFFDDVDMSSEAHQEIYDQMNEEISFKGDINQINMH